MKKEIKIGLFFLAVFIIFSFFVLKTNSLTKFWKRNSSYSVKSYFDNVAGIFSGSPVTMAGIKIGMVSKVELERNKALLTLLIENHYKIVKTAQCTIVTAGIVGEKFIEIRVPNEKSNEYLKDGDEIKSFKLFDMAVFAEKLDNMSAEFEEVAKSISNNFGDKENQESIKGLLKNLNLVSEKINLMVEEKGEVKNLISNFNELSKRLIANSKSLEKIISGLDSRLLNGENSLVNDLKNYLKNLDKLTSEIREITSSINKAEGSAGKLIKKSELYDKAKKSIDNIEEISIGIREKQAALTSLSSHYCAGLRYSPKKSDLGFSVSGGLETKNYSIMGRARESMVNGKIRWSAAAGKKMGLITLYGGIVDSQLGVIAATRFFENKLNLSFEMSDFSKQDVNPNFSTVCSFELFQGFSLLAGLDDFLRKENRRFYIGISFGK